MKTSDQSNHRPYLIGLTGGIGSGKSTISKIFADHGIAIVDTDAIAHELTAPNGPAIAAIRAAFGDAAIRTDHSMDRDWMRQRVFDNSSERTRLESILHPLIRQLTDERIAQSTSPYVIMDTPLLVEWGNWGDRCDRVLVVDCAVETQITRVLARNNLSRERIETIIAAQATREARLAAADDVIDNNGSVESAIEQANQLHQKYLKLANQHGDRRA
ncbi:MAG: dephospho-CoA kinase [Burkholderiaceae bacterium]